MNKIFKDIRNNHIDVVKAAIIKNPAIVNECFDGKSPKKDIGQSPLQVAIKCGKFEIIDLLLENGADVNFMEDPALVPPHSTCMPVLHDAIIGAMDSILYQNYEDSKKYLSLIETLLIMGADSNKEAFCKESPMYTPPVSTLIAHAQENLSRYKDTDANAFDISKKTFFDILDLLKTYGADFEKWLDADSGGDESNRAAYLSAFVPKDDKVLEMKFRGRIMKSIIKGDMDQNMEIRAALQKYFNQKDRKL